MAIVVSGTGGGRQRRWWPTWCWGQTAINQKEAAIAAERVVVVAATATMVATAVAEAVAMVQWQWQQDEVVG